MFYTKFKSLRIFALRFVFLFILSLVTIEIIFRFFPAIFQNKISSNWYASPSRIALARKVQSRIVKNWSTDPAQRPNVFFQPWVVYENSDFENIDRINLIAAKTKFEPNLNLVAPNVFRSPNEFESSSYSIKTNSLGFRDIERKVKKTKNTFRILVLGTYFTFGYGVNGEDTFVRRLEKKLNESKLFKLNFEVWNIGRHGSTAIMGYSLLKTELFKYSPDLILFDYGWPDLYTSKDSIIRKSNVEEGVYFKTGLLSKIFQICYINSASSYFLQSTDICQRISAKISERNIADNLFKFKFAVKKLNEITSVKKVPRVFLKLNSHISKDVFLESVSNSQNSYVIDLFPKISSFKPSEMEINNFWNHPNWLDEVGLTRTDVKDYSRVYLRKDAIQYSELAHKLVSDELYDELIPIIKSIENLKAKN